MKSHRDDLIAAQGKRGTSAALGKPASGIVSLSSRGGGEGRGEEALRNSDDQHRAALDAAVTPCLHARRHLRRASDVPR
jgi:hypothetical protein